MYKNMDHKVPTIIKSFARFVSQLDIGEEPIPINIYTDIYKLKSGAEVSISMDPISIPEEQINQVSDYLKMLEKPKFYFTLFNGVLKITTERTSTNCILNNEVSRMFYGNVREVRYETDDMSRLEEELYEIGRIIPSDFKIRVILD